jgi:hypothetical protein
MLKAIEQGKLVDENGPQSKALRVNQSFGGHLSMSIEDAFEMFVEIFDSDGTEFVKEAAHAALRHRPQKKTTTPKKKVAKAKPGKKIVKIKHPKK